MLFDIFSSKKQVKEAKTETQPVESNSDDGVEMQRELSPEMLAKLDKLKKIQSVVSDFETSISQAKSTSSRSETSLASVHDLLRTAEQDITKNARLVAENEDVREQLQITEERLDEAKADIDNKASMIDSLKARTEETREALQQAHVDLSQNIKRVELLNTQNDDLRSRMNENSFELANVNESVQKLEAENEQMRVVIKENTEEISIKSHEIAENQRELEEARRFLEIENTRREQLTSNLEDIKIKLKETSREKIDIETKLEIATNDLTSRSKHFKEQMRAKDDRIYALESKSEALDAHSRVSEQTVEQFKEENRDLMKALSDEDDRLRSAKLQMDQIKTSHNSDREKLFASVNRISELELRIASLIDSKEQAIGENIEFSQMIDRLTTENRRLSERLISLNSIEAKYNQLMIRQEKLSEEIEESKIVSMKSTRKKSA